MFTDRFIKVPVNVVDTKQKELYGEENAERTFVRCMINPFEISDYREDIGEGEKKTVVCFKNGSEMVIECFIEDFEKLLNNF